MQHLTIGIFGSPELAKKMAKSGTINDLAIYSHASSEGVFTYVYPASEKLQPLLQCVHMIDFPIVVFKEVTKELGEQIVAVDAANFHFGIIASDGVPEEQIRQMTKGSSLERFAIVPAEPAEIRQQMQKFQPKRDTEAPVWMPLDNYFDVKGVGTVVLTIAKSGKVRKYDNLRIEPLGKEIMVKSMQSQDKDIESAEAGMRLGMSIKGADSAELKRGYVLCKSAKVAKELKISYHKSRYTKEEISKGGQVFICAGLQVIAGKVSDTDGSFAGIVLEHPIAFQENEKILIGSTKPSLPRVIGSGKII